MRARSPLLVFGVVVFACAAALVAGRSLGFRLASPGGGGGGDGAIVVAARDRDPGDEDLDPHDAEGLLDGADAAGGAGARGGGGLEGGDADGDGAGGAARRAGGPGGPGAAGAGDAGRIGGQSASSGSGGAAPRAATATAGRDGAAPPATAPEPPVPDAAVAGRVTDLEGRALAGARVKLVSGRRTYHEATADPDGRYSIAPVMAGRYRLIARAAGFVDGEYPGALDVPPGSVTAADVSLRPSGAVTGVVLGPDGEGVPGARVAADRGGAYGGIAAASGPDGRFELRGLGAGRARLRASHPDFLPSKPVDVTVPKLEDGSGGAVEGVALTLGAGGAIEGGTFAADGTPIAIAVSLYDGRGRRVQRVGSKVEGGYRFEALVAGTWQVATDPQGGAVAREDVVLAAGERRRLDLMLTGGGAIAGRCIDEQGEPVAGARVTAAAQGIGFAPAATSGGDGRFTIEGLFDAQYIVSVRPPDRYSTPDPIPVVVAGGVGPRDLAFELRSGAIVSGRVFASDGAGAGGARVSIYDEAGTLLAAADADPAGRYRLTRVAAERATLYASAAGELARAVLVLAAGEERILDIELAPPARIRGIALLASGAPANGAVVEARSPDGAVRRASRAGRDGAFDLRNLYPGRYAVRATSGRAVSETLEFEVGARQVIEGISLTLR